MENSTSETPVPTPTQSPEINSKKERNKKLIPAIGVLSALFLLIVIGILYAKQVQSTNDSKAIVTELEFKTNKLQNSVESKDKELQDIKEGTGETNIDKDNYQAVFFKSGQVYFGAITKITTSQIVLENIYYLRSNDEIGSDVNNPTGDVSLTKLGDELHGPQDVMFIERAQVDFWENLKPDGQVAKAIDEYEKANPQ